MIVLDTNVLSALMLASPDEVAVAWLDAQPVDAVWTTSVTVFEIRYGLAVMPEGAKRQQLRESFERVLEGDLAGRVLSFEDAAAAASAEIAAKLRRAGRPNEVRDTMIAGIVASRGGVLATRNLRHFHETGVSLVNPWG